MHKPKILTIDDDPDILDVLDITLSEFYDVTQASNGEEGLKKVRDYMPDVIVCDCVMPIMNGREFCRQLKQDSLLMHIPVLMVTGKGEVQDRIAGIEAGVDDYIIKPFDPNELLARIKMTLRRTMRSLDANALTHLPGNTTIMDELKRHIDSKKSFAVGYADLDKFKIYNDVYGFEKGDEVIKNTARILIKHVSTIAGSEGFVGHIGGDDFVFISKDEIAEDICRAIIKDFDDMVPSFYTDEDIKRGYISGEDRQGHKKDFGLLSISIGIVSTEQQEINHVAQVAEIGAELKKYAKSFEQSNFLRDQRKT